MPLIANPEDVDVSGDGWRWHGGLKPLDIIEAIAESSANRQYVAVMRPDLWRKYKSRRRSLRLHKRNRKRLS